MNPGSVDPLILVPAHNEAASLPQVVQELRGSVPGADILIVDDGSTDGTATLVPTLSVRWVRLSERLGTGAAVRTGLRYAASRGHPIVVRIDGDGQHPAGAVETMLAPLREGHADVVIGSRYLSTGTAGTPVLRRLSHRILGVILSVLTGRRVTDPTSGLWAFGPRAIRLLVDHHPSGYPEPELYLFLSRNGVRIAEVPVCMRDRIAGRSSLTAARTGAAFLRLLLLLVVVPLRSAIGGRR